MNRFGTRHLPLRLPAFVSPVQGLGTLLCACTMILGCAGSSETAMKKELSMRRSERENGNFSVSGRRPSGVRAEPGEVAPIGATSPIERSERGPRFGSVSSYVGAAMEESPELQAAFERWRASVRRIPRARALPGPTLSFGYFVRSVETRVGPQRARIGLSQAFPWPTRLTASAAAASESARAAQSQVDALALRIQSQVVTAYYQLWLIRKLRTIQKEHLEVLRSLSETILARVATGATTLAEQQQIDLSVARLQDMLASMAEKEIAAQARLRAIIGTRLANDFPTTESPPEARLPAAPEDTLASATLQHPFLESYDYRASAHEHTARALSAEGLPSFSLGADWIIVGQARMPDVPDSGKDAVMVGGGISLPLWGGSGENAEAARAEARASRSEKQAMEDRALLELRTRLSEVRDSVRRVDIYQHTLVPQAETAYVSVLGSYVAGTGTVAQTLLAQRELLELRGEFERARAEYAIAWAGLEEIVGRDVRRAQVQNQAGGNPKTSAREERLSRAHQPAEKNR